MHVKVKDGRKKGGTLVCLVVTLGSDMGLPFSSVSVPGRAGATGRRDAVGECDEVRSGVVPWIR